MPLKTVERKKAETLRLQGLSYYEIMEKVPVSIASLSVWLKEIELTSKQQQRLKTKIRSGQQAGGLKRHTQRLEGIRQIDREIRKQAHRLLADSFFVLGLALYWAEGAKQKPWSVSRPAVFGNSDARLILMMRKWFQKYFSSESKKFGYRLHIHESANIEKAKKEWSRLLRISNKALAISLKKHASKTRHENSEYKGLIQLKVYNSVLLNRRIERWTILAGKHFLGIK